MRYSCPSHLSGIPLQHTATHCNKMCICIVDSERRLWCGTRALCIYQVICCNTPQRTATKCAVLLLILSAGCGAVLAPCAYTRSSTATHCNTLQHTATHCTTLQHTAPHCNTLQHTATHCNTLQHTATHCSTHT